MASQRDVNPLVNKDVLESLREMEKIFCHRMSRVEIQGKRGWTLPVILTQQLANAIEQLNLKRREVGLADENNSVSAKPSSTHIVPGYYCLHKLAIEAVANDPASLTQYCDAD